MCSFQSFFRSRYVSDFGSQLLNKETKLPLVAGYGVNWKLDGNVVALDEESRIIDLRNEKALDRGWVQSDGVSPGIYTPHEGPNQKWTIEIQEEQYHLK